MFDSLFSDPPRVLTKFKARKRTLSRLKYASRDNDYIEVPLFKYSLKTQLAMGAAGGGFGGLAIVLPIKLLVDERQPEVTKTVSRECIREAGAVGLPLFVAFIAIAMLNLMMLADL
jgi:hypothetical protein